MNSAWMYHFFMWIWPTFDQTVPLLEEQHYRSHIRVIKATGTTLGK